MRVSDKYRTNPLSLQPGGHTIHVVFEDGFEQTYDKVKYPKAFVKKIHGSNKRGYKIINVYVDGKQLVKFL
jgi:hypothetical protein